MRCALLLASLLTVMAVGCDGYTSVTGRVVDPEGKPIANATVKFMQQPDKLREDHSRETTTDKDGHFGVSMSHAPTKTMPFLLEVSKEGFVQHEERLTGTASYEKEIVLQPVKK
jgi:hypothetical protein